MTAETKRVFIVLALSITVILALFRLSWGLGFLAGCLLSWALTFAMARFCEDALRGGASGKGAFFGSFLFRFAIMAAFLVMCAKLPRVLNIFAGAAGLILIKPAIIIAELRGKKGERTDDHSE